MDKGVWYMFYDREPTLKERWLYFWGGLWYNLVEDYLVWREDLEREG